MEAAVATLLAENQLTWRLTNFVRLQTEPEDRPSGRRRSP